MNREALFCDGSSYYVRPAEPEAGDRITLRFRTAKDDVNEVKLITKDMACKMIKRSSTEFFDYYEIEWVLSEKPFYYHFEIHSKDEVCYYNRVGAVSDHQPYYTFMIQPGFSTPQWAKGAVMYQIFVDRFNNGNPTNDVETGEYYYIGAPATKVENWDEFPENMDIQRFYGGDLQGVWDKLDYLQDLGVEVIYFNPLFVSPSNHKYDIQDYDYIDPHYGKIVKDGGEILEDGDMDNSRATKYQIRTGAKENLEASNEFFAQLVEEMHRRNMKVILDGVFNHCGSFNKWMDKERLYEGQEDYEKGAYVDAYSPYHSFFRFFEDRDELWPYNYRYDGWWGHDTLPKLNYEDSSMLEDYIMAIGRKWVSPPYNVDGWRLDVAADLGYTNEYNHMFWKRFRQEVKKANPNAIIIAEHYGEPRDWLQGDEWDTVMNYDAFMEPLTWFLTGMEKHSDERRIDLWGNADNFVNSMSHFMSSMLTPSLMVAMNELSNHDHSRFLTRTNHIAGRVAQLGSKAAEEGINYAVMREAVVVQMTWIGAPTIYYGDEVGVCGFTDPDNRRTYPWGNENKELLEFHKDIIRIHKESDALKYGSLKMLCWENNVLAYARFTNKEQIVVVLNNSKEVKKVTIPVWLAGAGQEGHMRRVLHSYEESYTLEKDEYLVENGEIVMNIGRHSAVIMKSRSH
ncbi:MAG: glycoside hydrolase family 13 protein [Hespellia sp.]|nr:glycoside hydrolase family 13 protein [Hespellia sp.]